MSLIYTHKENWNFNVLVQNKNDLEISRKEGNVFLLSCKLSLENLQFVPPLILSLLFLEGETVMKVLPLSQGKYYADTCHDKMDRGDAT